MVYTWHDGHLLWHTLWVPSALYLSCCEVPLGMLVDRDKQEQEQPEGHWRVGGVLLPGSQTPVFSLRPHRERARETEMRSKLRTWKRCTSKGQSRDWREEGKVGECP